jgi:hypothetical protein
MNIFFRVFLLILLTSCSAEQDLGNNIILIDRGEYGIEDRNNNFYLHSPESIFKNEKYIFGILDGGTFKFEKDFNESDSHLCRFFKIDLASKKVTFEFLSENKYNGTYKDLVSRSKEIINREKLLCDFSNKSGKAAPEKYITQNSEESILNF